MSDSRDPWLREHRDLYLTNAFFRYAADQLVPLLLDGLASHAREREADLEAQAEKMKWTATRLPPPSGKEEG